MNSKETETEDFGASHCSSDYGVCMYKNELIPLSIHKDSIGDYIGRADLAALLMQFFINDYEVIQKVLEAAQKDGSLITTNGVHKILSCTFTDVVFGPDTILS